MCRKRFPYAHALDKAERFPALYLQGCECNLLIHCGLLTTRERGRRSALTLLVDSERGCWIHYEGSISGRRGRQESYCDYQQDGWDHGLRLPRGDVIENASKP